MKFFLYRRNISASILVTVLECDDMDAAINLTIPAYASGSSDIDCISDGCTMIMDDTGECVEEYALVEERDWCATCQRDYDAMGISERGAHGCVGEMIVTTCDGRANGVVWS